MKKLSIKSLLIVALVLILTFALVACNGDKDKDKEPENPSTGYTAKEYFDKLWTLSGAIGKDAVASGSDLFVGANLEVNLATKKRVGNAVSKSTNLNIELEAYIDRTSENMEKSAVKLHLYAGAKEVATVYYFLNDAQRDNIYIDFDGQHIVFSAHTDYNKNLGTFLADKLDENLLSKKTISINDVLDELTANMGKGWNLNDLVNVVVKAAGIDLKAMLEEEMDKEGSIVATIANVLKLQPKDLFDANGNVDLQKILGADLIGNLFKKVSHSGNTYTLDLAGSLIQGFIPTKPGVKVIFTEDNSALKDLTVTADFTTSVGKEMKDDGTLTNTDVYPSVSVKIDRLDVKAAGSNKVQTAVTADQYTSEVAVKAAAELNFNGIKIDTKPFSQEGDGVTATVENLKVEAAATVDLNSEYANNQTKASLVVKYGDKKVIEAAFVNGRLSVVPGDAVLNHVGNGTDHAEGKTPVFESIVNVAGKIVYDWVKDTFFPDPDDQTALTQFAEQFFAKDGGQQIDYKKLNPDFKGAVFEGIDIHQMFVDKVNDIAEYRKYLGTYKLAGNDKETLELKGLFGSSGKAIYTVTTPKQGAEKEDKVEKTEGTFKYDKTENKGEFLVNGKAKFTFTLDKQAKTFTKADAVASAAAEEEKKKVGVNEIFNTIAKAISVIKGLENGKVELYNADILAKAVEFTNILDVNRKENWTEETLTAWVVNKVKEAIAGFNKDHNDILDEATLKNAADALLIEGVTPFDPSADGADAVDWLVKALANNLKGNVTLRFTDGLECRVKAQITDKASVEVGVTLDVVPASKVTFADLCSTVHENGNGYFYWNFKAAE